MRNEIQINPENGKVGPGINPLNHKVFTSSGIFLGKVVEFEIDTNFDVLKNITVVKRSFFWDHTRIIEWENIIEITEKRIIVKDNLSRIKKTTLSLSDSVA